MTDVVTVALERDELNVRLGGGLPKDALILIEGKDGDGKSILAQRLSYALLEHNHEVTYVSTELDTLGFLKQMQSVDYDIEKYLLHDKLMFISAYPSFGNPEVTGDNFEELMKKKKLFEKEFVVFDTLSSYLVHKELDLKKAFEIMRFFKKIISMNKTVITCINPEDISPVLFSLIKNACDVYIKMETKEVLGNTLKIMNLIRYQRSKEEVTLATPIKIIPNVGIAIEIAALG